MIILSSPTMPSAKLYFNQCYIFLLLNRIEDFRKLDWSHILEMGKLEDDFGVVKLQAVGRIFLEE